MKTNPSTYLVIGPDHPGLSVLLGKWPVKTSLVLKGAAAHWSTAIRLDHLESEVTGE